MANHMRYALITPVRNEEALIGQTLESVVAQTALPERWVIVDDGSTDTTPAIVEGYARRYPWIRLIRRPLRQHRSFAGKADAFNIGWRNTDDLDVDIVGNLDADITFDPDHFEFLLGQFSNDPKLGVAGTAYVEKHWDSTRDSFEGEHSVHGACQLFRVECLTAVGGYVANPAGGVDWIAVTTARMKGWTTRNFPQRRFHHHRKMGTAERSVLGSMFDYGKKDYFLGGSPVWQLCRVAYRTTKKPLFGGGLALLAGYCWAALARPRRAVSPELMRFHRGEQMHRLRVILTSLLTFRKVENYYLEPRGKGHS